MKPINEDKRLKAITHLKDYKYAYSCKLCHVIYGSDFPGDDGICHKCSLNNKEKK